jgi:hypothetical protein
MRREGRALEYRGRPSTRSVMCSTKILSEAHRMRPRSVIPNVAPRSNSFFAEVVRRVC